MRGTALLLAVLGALVLAVPVAPATAASRPARLSVLVTNDDGVAAPGIDALVRALRRQPALAVTVVAPAKNESGTGSKATRGALKARPARTKSGYRATAVAGYPVDTITYALSHQFKRRKPDLVVSGINFGQNIGPFLGISGTVGAALAAGKHGIPALATSQGLGNPANFPAAAQQTITWLKANRAHLHKGRVVSINTPTCSKGHVRGILSATVAASYGVNDPFGAVDCSTTAKPVSGSDVDEYYAGYATIGVLRR